jgi:hypothetical protein
VTGDVTGGVTGGVTDWAQVIGDARAGRVAALGAEERAILAALDDGYPVRAIAAALDLDRQTIYQLRPRHGDPVTQPPATPLVFLRATRHKDDLWVAVEQAMWLRGWRTTHDRTTAWHSARAGTPTILCEFTLGAELVSAVAAKYTEGEHGRGEVALPRGTAVRPASTPRDTLAARLAHAVGQVLDRDLTRLAKARPAR